MAKQKVVARFVKLSATGRELSPKATKWAQVFDRETGLIWCAEAVGGRVEWSEAAKVAETCRVGKQTWRVPTIKELFSLVDHSRSDPAIDTAFFKCEAAFHWSSTVLASSPGDFAWGVLFYDGNAYYYLQNGAAFVRPVRSARASQ